MIRLATLSVLLLVSAIVAGTPVPQARELIDQLARVRLDRNQVFSVRDITIRRDVFSISLNRGTLAFTEPLSGKVTGAVFIGSGEILAIPPDRIEKQQLYRFTNSALLNERFEAAVFRFTDGTFEEIIKEIRGRAADDVTAEESSEILRWDSELQRRSRFLNGRILADLLGNSSRPFFLAQVEGRQLGWFDAVFDDRRREEVFIEQNNLQFLNPTVWVSFDKRSDRQGNSRSTFLEKEVADLVSYEVAGQVASLKLRMRVDGETVLEIPAAASGDIAAVALKADSGEAPLAFVAGGSSLSVVLPKATRRGEEFHIQITYTRVPPSSSSFPELRQDAITPESYRDQWIIDGIANYAGVVGGGLLPLARSQLLQQSPQSASYESLGPVAIGFRMTQRSTTPAGTAALRNKSVWILHMLRALLRRGDTDKAFAEMVQELQTQFAGRTISTEEFRMLAEKYAGEDLDWFFEQWVYGTGIPHYALNYSINATTAGFVVQGRISQSGVPETFTMPVPVFGDDVLLGTVTVKGDGSEFRFMSKTKPAVVHLDRDHSVLAVVTGPSVAP